MIDIIKEYSAHNNHEFKLTEIEKGYDNKAEVENHLWADVIITQSPVYWFGTPWIHKKYIDEVFMAGYGIIFESDGRSSSDASKQYGTGGKLQGKKYMLSLTWNAPEDAFNNKNQYLLGGASVDDAFIAHNSIYKFCGADILQSFSCFDVVKNPNVDKYTSGLKIHLEKYIC